MTRKGAAVLGTAIAIFVGAIVIQTQHRNTVSGVIILILGIALAYVLGVALAKYLNGGPKV